MVLQIDELLALQAVDNEISRLQLEQDELDKGDRVERALAVRQARLTNAERRLQGLEVEQRNAELELKSLEDKKHAESRKLYEGRVTAPRELQALQAEVDALERQRQRLDEAILRRLEEIETARKTVDTAQASVNEAQKALDIVVRRYEKAKERIDAGMKSFKPKRTRLANALQKDALRRYEEIRRRNHNIAAVRIENGACGGCRMKVGAAVLRRIAANEGYVHCESCTRFLFAPAEEAVPARK